MTTYRWPADIGWVLEPEYVIVALLPDGPPRILAGSGGDIWLAADGASEEEMAAQLGADYGLEPESLLDDIRAYCAELVANGLLEIAEG